MPDLSVVMLTVGGESCEFFQQALATLEEHTSDDYELIVVVNDDCDRAVKLAEAYGATKVLKSTEMAGFGEGMNRGFAEVSPDAKYIVCTNDDVLFTPDWDTLLRDCLDMYHAKDPNRPQAGMVGPLTNYAGGFQMVNSPQLNPTNCAEHAKLWAAKNALKWDAVAFISGFCFMMSREFFDERIEQDGFIFNEEWFPVGGAEDNDLCVRALRAGWSTVICAPCFIYHYGSKTINRIAPEALTGVRNLKHLYQKWKPKEEQTLGALFRVKLTRDYQVPWFLDSLRNAATFVDRFYILDDQSPAELWPTAEIEEICGDKLAHYERRTHKKIEGQDRQDLYKWACEDGCDWAISIDADEVFEDKFDRAYAERLMRVPHPAISGYSFHWYHFWNSDQYWRADGVWGQMGGGCRMYRCLSGFRVPNKAFHVGNAPALPEGSIALTSVRIKHYGNMIAEERQRKYEFYQRTDSEKNAKLIGNDDYSHIIDETAMQLMPWQEDNGISLVTIMRDEEATLHNFLPQFWAFADEIVLCDTGSVDASIEIAEMWGCRVIERDWNDDFSAPRNAAMKMAKHEWILQFDVDESTPELRTIRREIERPVAYAYGFYVYNQLPTGRVFNQDAIRLFRNDPRIRYHRWVHETVTDSLRDNDLQILRSECVIHHPGFMSDPEKLKRKLKMYFRIGLRQLAHDPFDAATNYNLAMHFLEGGQREVAERMLQKAIALDNDFTMALESLGVVKAQEARAFLAQACQSLPEGHNNIQNLEASIRGVSAACTPLDTFCPEHVAEVLAEEEFVSLVPLLPGAQPTEECEA